MKIGRRIFFPSCSLSLSLALARILVRTLSLFLSHLVAVYKL